MAVWQKQITVETKGQGLHGIDGSVKNALKQAPSEGIVHLFLQHTSASLVIQESADPSAKKDLEEFINRLIPEGKSWYRHLDEGPDDTVSHMKASITNNSLSIPLVGGKLGLGTWQGIYLWEHRRASHHRRIVITVVS